FCLRAGFSQTIDAFHDRPGLELCLVPGRQTAGFRLRQQFFGRRALLPAQIGCARRMPAQNSFFVFSPTSATMMCPQGGIPMSIAVDDLRNFQSRELEQPNMQTNGRQPVFTKTIEWSLIEIVILLTQIRDAVNPAAASKP